MNKIGVRTGRSRPGSAIALVVIVIVIFLVTGAGLLTLGANARIYAVRTAADISARCAADAGLTKAHWAMNDMLTRHAFSPTNLPVGTGGGPLDIGWNCDATFSYKVGSGGSTNPNRYVVESIGRCGVAERKVYGLLRLQGAGECGVMVQTFAIFKPGTIVDGRDSRDPTNLNPPVKVQIGTKSTSPASIILYQNVYIDGDVLVGFGGDPDIGIKDMGATITGYKGSLDEEPEFPPVTVPIPPLWNYNKEIEVKGEDRLFTPLESGKYTGITLKQKAGVDANLVIVPVKDGGKVLRKVVLHITGDIDLGQGCEIQIRTIKMDINGDGLDEDVSASLELYVGGNIISHEDSGFNNLGLPPDLKLWGLPWDRTKQNKRPNFDIKAKSEYFGLIYAPDASITVMAKGDLYGAFTAYSFEMKSGGNLFYDAALSKTDITDPTVHFVMTYWWE